MFCIASGRAAVVLWLSPRRQRNSWKGGVARPLASQRASVAQRRRFIAGSNASARPSAMLIVNADDWGRDVQTTDRIHRCVQHGSVSSVSAMVFMKDSERAAAIALETETYAALHLN